MSECKRLLVLISGNGSNLQAILDAIQDGELAARVAAVISNKPDAYGLERARVAGVPGLVKPKLKDQTRDEYDRDLAEMVGNYQPDWIILAGWMRILGMSFLGRFPGRVINLHPALPGMFAGVNAIERAYDAYQQGEITHTGVMVHLVPDDGVDCGPLLTQAVVDIYPGDTLEDLENRVHGCEHVLLVQTIKHLVENKEEILCPER